MATSQTEAQPASAGPEPMWVVYRLDLEKRVFRAAEARGIDESSWTTWPTFRMAEEHSLVGLVAARNQARYVPDVGAEPRLTAFDETLGSAYLTPMATGSDVVGVLVVYTRSPHELDAAHRALADALAKERAKAWANLVPAEHPDSSPPVGLNLSVLSQRERDVVNALCRGMRLSDIARVLGISSHTARNHLKHVFRKLGVHSQVELLAALGRPTGVP